MKKKNDKGITLRVINGKYHARFRIQKHEFTRATKATNEKDFWIQADCIYDAEFEKLAGVSGKLITLGALCEKFLKHKAPNVAEGTLKMFRCSCNRAQGFTIYHRSKYAEPEVRYEYLPDHKILPEGETIVRLGDSAQHVHLITEHDFDVFVTQMQSHVQLSNYYLRLMIGRIGQMFEYAKANGYAVPNIAWSKHNKNLKTTRDKSRTMTINEKQLIVEKLRKSKAPANAVKFILMTTQGLRISEVCKLLVRDFDEVNKLLRVRRSKGGGADQIVLNDVAFDELVKLKGQLPKGTHYFFQSKCGGPQKPQGSWLDLACKKLGLNPVGHERITSHMGRATFCTDLTRKGMNAFSVQQCVRHRNINTTMFYVRLAANDSSREAADMMSDENKKLAK